MTNLIPVTLKSVEFRQHQETINNIGRISHATIETNCIITLAEDYQLVRTGENDPSEGITIIGRSITHDPDDLEVVQREKAYADALNKIHMLGLEITNALEINFEEEEPVGNIFEELNETLEIPEV